MAPGAGVVQRSRPEESPPHTPQVSDTPQGRAIHFGSLGEINFDGRTNIVLPGLFKPRADGVQERRDVLRESIAPGRLARHGFAFGISHWDRGHSRGRSRRSALASESPRRYPAVGRIATGSSREGAPRVRASDLPRRDGVKPQSFECRDPVRITPKPPRCASAPSPAKSGSRPRPSVPLPRPSRPLAATRPGKPCGWSDKTPICATLGLFPGQRCQRAGSGVVVTLVPTGRVCLPSSPSKQDTH